MDEYIEKDKVRKMKDSVIIKRLLKYTKPFIWKFVLVLVLMLFVVVMDVLTPLLLGEVLERLGDDVINIGKSLPQIYSYSIDNIKVKINDLVSLRLNLSDVIKITVVGIN